MVLAELRVGPVIATDATINGQRADKTGAAVVTDAHAKFHEAVSRRKVFFACNSAAAAVTNLATTATGLIISNPIGSSVMLSILRIGFIQTSTAAAAANAGVTLATLFHASTAVVHTTPLIVRSTFISDGTIGSGLVDSAATLPTAPVRTLALWQPSVSATATTGIPPATDFVIDGIIILGPGAYLSMNAEAALSGITSIVWEEIAI